MAIVGRPNVGKSRLFNRYAGQRRALVDDRPGITRDRIAEEIELLGRRFLLVDTAGLEPSSEGDEGLEAAVQAQAEVAVGEADAILFVVDGKAGLLPQDEALARTLRRSDKPLALAVNKIDQPGHRDRTNDFHALGFERLAAISAEHGGGCFEILEELVGALPQEATPASDIASDEVRIALVGRPNVGKSSLTNRIAGNERVVVSDRPGTTRDRIDIPLEQDGSRLLLMDTAGLRRPGRRDRTAERGSALMTVRSLERAHVGVLVIDASEGLTDQDAHVAAEICERGCAAVVLANKWDLVGREEPEAKAILEQIEHGLRFMPEVSIVPVSAKTGARLKRFLPAVLAAASAAERRISTPDLNRWLQQVVRMHEPAADRRGGRGRAIRFLYATQTAVRPPTFVLFCNEPRRVQVSYRRFLENKLREAFDFRGTPVRIRLRARSRSDRSQGRRGSSRNGRASPK
ncbi:MAG: ribosome biogenesis GTPase Der [Myxococcota bacterium]|nr:ribosome biogenesis GTPase Der [Myxococcota bacterium]